MKRRILFISYWLLIAFQARAQVSGCPCDLASLKLDRHKFTQIPTFVYSPVRNSILSPEPKKNRISETVSSARTTIQAIDSTVKDHFDRSVKEQLRGRADSYQDRKYIRADPHARFLCQLDSLSSLLAAYKVSFDRLPATNADADSAPLVPSVSPLFQAYLNSLHMYHDQSRNLVNWFTLTQRPGEHRKPVRYVQVHEGSINSYNQSYNFVELCKNNLLKEFSILELAQTANTLKMDTRNLLTRMDSIKIDLEIKNQALQDCLTTLETKLDSIRRDPLLQTIREARQTHKRRRVIIKVN